MESKGPYKHSDYHRMTKAHSVSCLACAYAEGRKAAEKVLKAGNLAWVWEEAKEALEADGEVGK